MWKRCILLQCALGPFTPAVLPPGDVELRAELVPRSH